MKILITESQYRKILIREFGESVDDPKIWYRRILEFVDKPKDLKFFSTTYEVTAYDDKGVYLGYYDKENNFGFVVTEYGVDKLEDDMIEEQEEGGGEDAPSGSSSSKWDDLSSLNRGPANTIDNTPWGVSPNRGKSNPIDNSPWDSGLTRGVGNQLF